MDGKNPFAMLQRFARPQTKTEAPEICEFCSLELSPQHRHLLETAKRKIICVCDACALRFENVAEGRFKLIPRDGRALPDFQLTDAQWENLSLPINLVFIFKNGANGKPVAFYPSPAGAMESLLPLANWEMIVGENPELENLQPDVEALLINRVGAARDYFIAPMDVCFELVGLIRKNWRGLSGGDLVWTEIEKYFAKLRNQTSPTILQNSREEIYA
jgi:hypothetical protein